MTNQEPIETRYLEARGRRITVLFSRNACGSVCGQFLFGGGDTPIMDGPTQEDVLATVEEMIDSLLLARDLRASALRERAQRTRRCRPKDRRRTAAKREQRPHQAAL